MQTITIHIQMYWPHPRVLHTLPAISTEDTALLHPLVIGRAVITDKKNSPLLSSTDSGWFVTVLFPILFLPTSNTSSHHPFVALDSFEFLTAYSWLVCCQVFLYSCLVATVMQWL
jgi:hypothetical protein